MTTTDNPVRNYKNKQTSNSNRGVVKRLYGYWVGNRQWEEYGNGQHPNNSDPAHDDSVTAQVERPRNEMLLRQCHPKEYGKGIGNIETYGCYGHHGLKSHYASKRLQYIYISLIWSNILLEICTLLETKFCSLLEMKAYDIYDIPLMPCKMILKRKAKLHRWGPLAC